MKNEVDTELQAIFSNVNDWLKFAEAKNGAIIAVSIALIVGIVPILDSEQINGWVRFYLITMTVFSGISFLAALMSFLPATQIPPLSSRLQPGESSNILFFGHIANHSVDSYLEALEEVLGEGKMPSRIGKAYIEQTIINSKIAVRKYEYFTASLFFLVAALTAIVGALLLLFVVNRYR